MIKILIFDFDGTIVDSKTVYYNSMFGVLQKRGYTYKDIDKAIDTGLSLKATLAKLGLNSLVIWFYKRKIMKDVEKYVNQIKKCKDVDSIKQISTEKVLVSNSLKEFMMPIIKHLKIKKYFSEIYGADSFGNKPDFIKQYLKKRKIRPEECFYIGDRVADSQLAKKVGCKSIIVSNKCSWDSRRELIKSKPDFIISDIADIKHILESNNA